MIITELEIKDLGPHKHIHEKGLGNIVGLFAPNGAGKSNILATIKAATTGQWDDAGETYVRDYYSDDYEGKPVNGFVRLVVSTHGRLFEFFRQEGKTKRVYLKEVTDASSTLHIKTMKEINAFVSDLFSTDLKAMAEAVFIGQGTLDKVFFGTPTERMENFQKILNLSYLGKRLEYVDGKISFLTKDIVDTSAVQDEVTRQLKEAQQDFSAAQTRLQNLPDFKKSVELLSVLLSICKDLNPDNVDGKDTEYRNALRSLEEVKNKLSGFGGEYDDKPKVDALLSSLRADASTKKDTYVRLQNIFTNYDDIKKRHENLARTEKKQLEVVSTIREREKEVSDILSFLNEHARDMTLRGVEDCRVYFQPLLSRLPAFEEDRKNLAEGESRFKKADKELDSLREEETKCNNDVSEIRKAQSSWNAIIAQHKKWLPVYEQAVCEGTCPADKEGRCFDCGRKLADNNNIEEKDLEDLRKNLAAAEAACADIEKSLEKETASCRTIEDKIKDLNQFKTQYSTLKAKWDYEFMGGIEKHKDNLRGNLDRLPLASSEKVSSEKQLRELNEEVDRLLENLPELPENKPDEDAVRKAREDVTVAETSLKQWETWNTNTFSPVWELYNKTNALVENLQDSVARLRNSLLESFEAVKKDASSGSWPVEVRNMLPSKDPTQEVVETIRNALQEKISERYEAAGVLESRKKTLESLEKRNSEILQQSRQKEVRMAIVQKLRDARSLLKKDGAPAEYVQKKFSFMVGQVNKQLEVLGAGFCIRELVSENCAFEFTKKQEDTLVWLPQNKLSGGEKVRLAISFLLIIQKVLVPHVGLLVVDEPSNHQDDDGKVALREYLQCVRENIDMTDLQIWVSDHYEGIRSVVTSQINIAQKT